MDIVRIGMVGARHGAALHHPFAVQAAAAGKHIIVEKPLTGYFGAPGDPEPIGEAVSKAKMLEGARSNAQAVREAAQRHNVRLCYAENWANVAIAFEDGTRGLVTVTDAGLGGLQAKIAVYMTSAVMHANMAQNTAVQAYAPDPDIFGQEYVTEKIETRAGWTFPSPDEGWFRGYPQEMQDFAEAIATGRDPLAGIDLAADCIEVIYAA